MRPVQEAAAEKAGGQRVTSPCVVDNMRRQVHVAASTRILLARLALFASFHGHQGVGLDPAQDPFIAFQMAAGQQGGQLGPTFFRGIAFRCQIAGTFVEQAQLFCCALFLFREILRALLLFLGQLLDPLHLLNTLLFQSLDVLFHTADFGLEGAIFHVALDLILLFAILENLLSAGFDVRFKLMDEHADFFDLFHEMLKRLLVASQNRLHLFHLKRQGFELGFLLE